MKNAATKWLNSNKTKFDAILETYGMTFTSSHLVDTYNLLSTVPIEDSKFIRLYRIVHNNHLEHLASVNDDPGIRLEYIVPWLTEKFKDVVLDFVTMTEENGKPFIRRMTSFNPHNLTKNIRYVTILYTQEKDKDRSHVEYIFNHTNRFGRLKEGENDSYEHIYPDDDPFLPKRYN